MKKAIVVVSFGSTIPSAREELNRVEQYIGEANPDRDLSCCYSSGFIRNKLMEAGIKIFSLEEILSTLSKEAYGDVFIQPTHIIPGIEYDKVNGVAEQFRSCFQRLVVGKPLLSEPEDIVAVSKILMKLYEQREEEALLLLGHGTEHTANFIYPALQTAFQVNGGRRVYIATVEGWPTLEDAMKQMGNDHVKQVFVAPFLLCAGDHVKNDMLGDSEESFLNQLIKAGFSVRYTEKGLGRYPEILAYYRKEENRKYL